MSGYISEIEDISQTGGLNKRIKRAKTVKQRLVTKARRDAKKMIRLSDTLPHEVMKSGFHYDEESSREVLEESRELGNQTDDESEQPIIEMPNPVIKKHSLEYRVVANKRPGGKPVLQIKGLALDYDNTQSQFVNAAYLENGRVTSGVLKATNKHAGLLGDLPPVDMQDKPTKKYMRKRTAKRQLGKK